MTQMSKKVKNGTIVCAVLGILAIVGVGVWMLFSDSRPKIGLVFGGGGAKAAAEIGALRVIEHTGVPVDYVVGSSMGAVVGGLYAAGYTAEELEQLWLTEDWLMLFDKTKFGIEAGDRTFFGLVKGGEFEDHLRDALSRKGCTTFEDIKDKRDIEFCCTATQIIDDEELKEVHLTSGDLAKAIRASLTYPVPLVGYAPVEIDGMKLVDGGMTNNLPVDVAKEMGADKVIAIDLTVKQKNGKAPVGVDILKMIHDMSKTAQKFEKMTKTKWLVNWTTDYSDVEKLNQNRDSASVWIHPINLSEFKITSFNQKDVRTMMLFGEDEARIHEQELLGLKQK